MTLELISLFVKYVAVALALCLVGCWAVEKFFDWFV